MDFGSNPGFSSLLPLFYCGERGIISTSCPQFSMVFGSNPGFSSQLPSCYCRERGIISTSCPQFSMVFGSNPGFSSLLPSFYSAERGGFEPPLRYRKHAFQACAFNRSATSPDFKFAKISNLE